MSEIAIYSGSTVIYWSSIIIALGIAAWFCLSYALYTANGGRGAAMWIFLPIAVLLSVFFSRFLHWYCHSEMYSGMLSAITDFSYGGYCLPGMLLGIFLAGMIVKALHLIPSAGDFFDALSPGAALGIALIRLSAFFNSSCRSTIIITDPRFQHLPLGIAVPTSTGLIEYRFATFFVQFLLMLILAVFLFVFYCRRHDIPMKRGLQRGNTALIFLLFYNAMEIVMDSTRYDSSFFRLNGFVSVVQIVGALTVGGILIYYSINSVKANGFKFYHPLIWIGFAAGLGLTGYFEYLVQRHGSWFLKCYAVMTLGCILMSAAAYVSYLTVCIKKKAD